ncbi:hypothetical protein XA68_12312 [Ophiocordyceps unilateralis]|uniref:Nuclease S1 n=1 Tax=Ophiocordyceps unilateralis TaxID=268505 RepID=A0A2A9PD49_OPHUN|nr:hypothetical protein XA68_12312 [Ophiocordyceps unilateralis]
MALRAMLVGLVGVPAAVAWGSLGHMTTAFVASHFVSNATREHFQHLLRNDDDDYLASVASWADSVRYMRWARFTRTFHFIDAHDDPPYSCNVDLDRDCKESGCVITALANYTRQSLDDELPAWRRAQAAKFVIHFVGDLHQPLHNEDVEKGGNGIYVLWDGKEFNLHHVWDTSIAEKWIGAHTGIDEAEKWANQLVLAITDGKFSDERKAWLDHLDFSDPIETAMAWSREANAFVCTHVLPDGVEGVRDRELGGRYFDKAGPVIERQVARAGYRMAAWLDAIADEFRASKDRHQATLEL